MLKVLLTFACAGLALAQNVAISQPQIVAVTQAQPVRTVIARPVTIQRVSQPPPPATVTVVQAAPPQPQPVTLVATQPAPTPVTVVRTVQAAPQQQETFPPRAYSFAYDTQFDDGSSQKREENGDANGVVRGSYSYRDADGLFRVVEYVADENGYRATVRTNEPGVAPSDPANVALEVEQTPEAVLQKYAASSSNTQRVTIVRAVQAAPQAVTTTPQPRPIAIALAQPPAQASGVKTVRVQSLQAQPATPAQRVRVIPVTGLLGSASTQPTASTRLIFLNTFG